MILTPTKTIRQAKRRVARLARTNPLMSPWALLTLAASEIRQTAPELAQRMAPALLKGWVDAARRMAQEAGVEHVGAPPKPPAPGLARFGPEPVRWPAIEASVQDLVGRAVVSWPEYQQLTEQAQATAFTTARVLAEDGIDRVRQAITETVAEGKTLKQFTREIGPIMANAGLGGHHIETIFRTSVGQAQAAGMRAVLQHPGVMAEFPYLAYHAIHDSRTGDKVKGLPSPTHLMMESLGIQGTNIYRADDPVILKFTPPWRWNCVPGETRVLTTRGEVRIDRVRRGDHVLTHRGRWRAVVGVHRSEGPAELVGADLEIGGVVRATGNHRVLTQRGWVEMAALQEKDYLYQVVQPPVPDLVRREIQHGPRSRLANGRVPAFRGDPIRPLYFDPDGEFRQPEIKPEGREGLVEFKGNPRVLQSGGGLPFVGGHAHLGVQVLRGVAQMAFPAGDARSQLRSRGSESFALRLARGFASWIDGVVAAQCLGSSSQTDAVAFKELAKGSKGHTSLSRDGRQINFASPVSDEHGFEAAGPVDPRDCFHGAFGGVRIKNLRSIFWGRQPVFNLSVDEDESYLADGVITHNCRCSVIPLSIEDAAAMGIREAIEWQRSGTPPITPTWVPHPPFDLPRGWPRGGTGIRPIVP